MYSSSITFNQPGRVNDHKGIAGYYSDIYFRIDKNGYTGQGWSDERIEDGKWVSELRQTFSVEVERLFAANGWSLEKSGRDYVCTTVTKEKSCLYLHPQDFAGVCENAEIEAVTAFLTGAGSFILRAVDVYEEIYDMSDEKLTEKLDRERNDIYAEIMTAYTTKRRNLYVAGTGPVESIGRRHSVGRLALGNRSDFHGLDRRSDGVCQTYAANIFQELLNSGKIVTANTKSGQGYRTAKKDELKVADTA